MPNYVKGLGPIEAKLAVVGEAPGYYEDQEGIPFVGPTGSLTREMLRNAGISLDDCYRTNVVKLRPPNNNFSKLKEIGVNLEKSTNELHDELRAIKPNCILALGDQALLALTGNRKITNYRGSILHNGEFKIVPSIHPAELLHNKDDEKGMLDYSAKAYMQLDFNRAVEESKTKEYNIPSRFLKVARDSLDVYRFLQAHKSCEKVAVDIESIHQIPFCVSFAFNHYEALSIPLLYIKSLAYPDGISKAESARILQLVAEFLESPIKKIGQHFKYDDQKLRKPLGILTRNLYSDTTFKSHVLYPEFPKNLAFLASIWTREPYYKDEGKEFHPAKDSYDRLFLYNAKDSAVDYEIDEAMEPELDEYNLRDFYYNHIMPLHNIYMNLEERGLRIDYVRRRELQLKYRTMQVEIQKRLNAEVGRHINVNSWKQVAQLLYQYLELPKRSGTDEDTMVALMNNTKKGKETRVRKILTDVIDIRRVRKTRSNYIEASPDFDGRSRCSYNITGTETGRSSTSIYKKPVRPIKMGVPFQVMTKHGEIGPDVRSQYIPDDGFVFVEIDMSQAEARIVALLARDYELLDKFNRGVDVHSETASWIFNWNFEEGMKAKKDERFIGKTVRHAGHYDMQKGKFMMIVNTDAKKFGIDISVSEYKAGKILDVFHSKFPNLRGVFHAEVKQMIDETRILINPYGRRREFFGRQDDSLYREAYPQIPSSTVRDHVIEALISIHKDIPDFQFLGESHDSIFFQVKEDELKDQVIICFKYFTREIDFSLCSLPRGKLVIPAEAQIGINYKDMKPYELD